jgi:aminoglycoside phosphotransferase (APT) family kinase protein
MYHLPAGAAVFTTLDSPLPAGVLDERQFVSDYCTARGLDITPSATDWSFYLGLSLFRLICILAGVQVGEGVAKLGVMCGVMLVLGKVITHT